MQEHPVPQNITAYQFRLIGNMTIKQFLILLAGMAIGFFFYSTNLPFIIKWPFIILFVLIAIAMAFLPYEERTLDQWLVNFLRAIYRPTKFSWKRTATIPFYFAYTTNPNAKRADLEVDWQPYRQQQVSAYLSSLGTNTEQAAQIDPLDLLGQAQSSLDLDALFANAPSVAGVTPGNIQENLIAKPVLGVVPRPLGSNHGEAELASATHTMISQTSGELAQVAVPVYVDTSESHAFTVDTDENKAVPQENLVPEHQVAQVQAVETVTLTDHTAINTLQQPEPIQTTSEPEVATVALSSTYMENVAPESQTTANAIPVVFNKDLPFPSLPTDPNMVIGMVHTIERGIIPGAIVEILEADTGMTVRALKTNSLGQFYSSSPLKPGTYLIETEADDHTFPVYELTVESEVLLPLDITAQL